MSSNDIIRHDDGITPHFSPNETQLVKSAESAGAGISLELSSSPSLLRGSNDTRGLIRRAFPMIQGDSVRT